MHILPDNTYTENVDEYVDAWKELGAIACKFFEGYVPTAYNPGIVIELREEYERDGEIVYRTLDRIDLSVEAVKNLQRTVDKLLKND